MGKSLKNSVTPDDMYAAYGADTLRLYEMSMAPITQDRPWETRSVVGSQRLLQRVWRNIVNEETGELALTDDAPSDDLLRVLHKTIDGVTGDMDNLRYNTAIAKLTELNNEVTKVDGPTPRVVADAMVRMLSPLVPHMAEELWSKLGGEGSVVADFPMADESLLVDDQIELPVQSRQVRGRIMVAPDVFEDDALVGSGRGERRRPRRRRRAPQGHLCAGPHDQPDRLRLSRLRRVSRWRPGTSCRARRCSVARGGAVSYRAVARRRRRMR